MPANLGELWEQSEPINNDELAKLWEKSAPIDQEPQAAGPDFDKFLATPRATEAADRLRGMVRDQIPVLGAIGGGMIGSGIGPAGTIGGAALGYSIGKQLIEPPKTALEGFSRVLGEWATGAALEMGGQSLGALISRYGVPTAQQLSSTIRKGIEKAIRPGVSMQRTATQTEQYFDRAQTAVETIIANRDNLKLVDETGNMVSSLPKTLKQFSQAIDLTKRRIFSEYDEFVKKAGKTGVEIDLNAIASKLGEAASDEVIATMSPDAVKYAHRIVTKLSKQGKFTPSQAQEAIRIANQSLESFYKNPTTETATKAWVDDTVAKHLRIALDEAVNSATGAEYQELKNVYGSLRAIEEDVGKRAAIDARKNIKGFFSLPDIWGGAELAKGFLVGDPGSAIAGATAKGLASYFRWRNNPNRIIKTMFSEAESIMTKMGIGGRTIYPEPIDPSGIYEKAGPKLIEWNAPEFRSTPLQEGAPLPTHATTGETLKSTTGRIQRYPAKVQIEGQTFEMLEGGTEGVPSLLLRPTEQISQASRPGPMAPDVVVPPRPPEIIYRPGFSPASAKIGAPLKTPSSPKGDKALLPPKPEQGGRIHGRFKMGDKEYSY